MYVGGAGVFIALASTGYNRARYQRRMRQSTIAQRRRTTTTTNNNRDLDTTANDDNARRSTELGFSETRFANYSTQYSDTTSAPAYPGSNRI